MLVIGLTGSIGAGKSTLAAHLRGRGIAVFDADAEVHRLYAGAAAAPIEAAFPGTTTNGAVDRARLAAALANNPSDFKRLENVVHPLVRAGERRFLHLEAARGAPMAVLEIPLLFETGGEGLADTVILASAPDAIRRERVLQRPGMSPEKLDLMVSRQMPEAQKQAKANFVVDTGGAIAESLAQLDRIIDSLASLTGTAFALHWS